MNTLQRILQRIGDVVLNSFEALGDTVLLMLHGLIGAFFPRYRVRMFLEQLYFVGVKSLPIILLTGAFTGMVFTVQSIRVFQTLNVETMSGATVTIALTRELAPVLTGLMVVARVGSAMATEIGTMRVTEQIDALETLAIEPVHYLISPRLLSALIMVPILTLYFNLIGVLGAWVVAVPVNNVDPGFFWGNIEKMVHFSDIMQGVMKSAIFGVVAITIACRQGLRAKGGARGVGYATTSAVVWGSVSILGLNLIMTAFFF
jgi:phospholipid/cholesterol/gamma-HCH transport system permease protein